MFSGSFIIDVLLNYAALSIAFLGLAAIVAILVVKRKTIAPSLRLFLIFALIILLAYFAFVFYAVIAVGNDPPFAYA